MKRGPKGDPNPQKSPLGDPGPLKGTHCVTVQVMFGWRMTHLFERVELQKDFIERPRIRTKNTFHQNSDRSGK